LSYEGEKAIRILPHKGNHPPAHCGSIFAVAGDHFFFNVDPENDAGDN